MKGKHMKVKLSEIIDAIEMTNRESESFLDQVTGEIVWFNDFAMTPEEKEEASNALDEHGFYRLPTSFDINEYSIMEDFVYSLPESRRERLARAISGKGAFRRFKDGIRQMGIEEEWYDYQGKAYKRMAIEWCEENGIEYEE